MATTTKAIWWDGSSTTCVEHMGITLRAELEAKPNRKTHTTRFGKAYLMQEDEIAEIRAIIGERELCEMCEYETGR